MFESFLKKIIAIDGIRGCITVDPQDGSVLLKEGNINPLLEEITAFFGSGFDVVASSLGIKGLKFSYLEKENQKFVIIVKEGGYIGCELSSDIHFEAVMENIQGIEKPGEEIKEPEKVSVSPAGELSQQTRFLESKIRQINLLIDEFSDREDRTQWIELVREKFSENEMGKEMISVVHFDNNKVIFKGNLDPETKEEDISTVSKLATDSLCRKAVEKFGAIEAKKKVHNVIDKLGITK